MWLYHCELELHENLFFATREMGRLYESERYLHNYALTYALGLAVAPYFHRDQVPNYRAELEPLNERGLYVTPARPLDVHYDLTTFKYASNLYHVDMIPARQNTPSFGRAKELAVGSRFEFGLVSQGELEVLPRWIRLGLWSSKARLAVVGNYELSATNLDDETVSFPLNPLDLADVAALGVYDLINMRPSSLVDNASFRGPAWRTKDGRPLVLPQYLAYRIPG